MKNIYSFSSPPEDEMNLPPGFRFHPSDEELITHYLSPKALDSSFSAIAIGEVDLNKVEPWDLPWRAKMGEKEWYFFCVRDRKYPTGMRTNRATETGYWKATGKDKEILREKSLIGMKKTLVFYSGRAPRGERTNWVMHEYRLEGNSESPNNEWMICRIFKKTSGGKKIHISALIRDSKNSTMPPLMDASQTTPNFGEFSDSAEDQKPFVRASSLFSSSPSLSKNSDISASIFFPTYPTPNYFHSNQTMFPCMENMEYEDPPFLMTGPVDIDCLWDY